VSISETPLPPDDGPLDPVDGPADPPRRGLLKTLLMAAPIGFVLAVIVAAAVWYFLPPGPSTAYVKLYMPEHPEGNFGEHPEAGIEFGKFQRTQFALLKSRPVLDAALRDPKVQQLDLKAVTKGPGPALRDPNDVRKALDPADWLEGQIRVETPDGPELPRVVLSGDDPEQLKVLLTALVDAYLSEVVNKRTVAHRVARLEKLDQVRKLYSERLKSIRETNKKLALAVGPNPDKIAQLRLELSMKELTNAKEQLVKVRSELKQAEFDAILAEKKVKAGAALLDPDKAVEELVEKALEKEVAARDKVQADLIAALKADPDENRPGTKALRRDLDEKKAFIEEQRKVLRPQYRDELKKQAQSAALVVPDKAVEERVEKALEKELAARDRLQADLVKARAMSPEGASDPKVREMAAALEKQKVVIAEQRKALRDLYREELQQQAQDAARADLAVLQEKIKYSKALDQTLAKEVEELTKLDNKIKADALDLGDSQVELKLAEAGYQKVMGEIDALKTEVGAPMRVSKWEDAVVVPPDDGPRRWKAAALAGLGAFALVLLLACLTRFIPWRRDAQGVVEEDWGGPHEELPGTPDAIPGE
jgi:hypothetical protein